jgi:hypothetical protein
MPPGTMQGLFRFLTRAFEDMKAPIPLEKLEKMAVMIYSAMSNPARNYHNLDHVFNFSDPPDPIRYLAAVFHDIVYYQVDDGISPELEADILPYLQQNNGGFRLVNPPTEDHTRVGWLLELFGFQEGQAITIGDGLNEFLSALVTVKNLGGLIDEHDLFAIVVCIEATIPFRGPDALGREQFDVMGERLYGMRVRYPFLGTPAQIDAALQRAVIFSNQDVETFRMADAARFLEITFKLLPESNVALRKRGAYTIRDYRVGLQKMERFLNGLNPEHVFNHYKGVPPAEEYAGMVQQAYANLQKALRYLKIKLLAMALLEGLAEATGGDAPLSLFMGDLPREGAVIERLEDHLPNLPLLEGVDPDSDLLRLFSEGLSELGFDLPYSPTSLFLYRNLTEIEQDALYQVALQFFRGEIPAEAFLASAPRRVVSPVASAIAHLVFTRREKLKPYMNKEPGL